MYKMKVTRIEPALDKHGQRDTYIAKKNGNTMYKTVITFEGGSHGVFDHEGETQDYFKVGQEAEFEVVKNEYGTKLYRAGKKKSPYQGQPKGWVPKSPGEIKREGLTFILGDVTKLVIAGKVEEEMMVEKYDELVEAFFKNVDKVKDE